VPVDRLLPTEEARELVQLTREIANKALEPIVDHHERTETMGLINDIPTVGQLVARIVDEAENLIIGRLADTIESGTSAVAI
jgi:hypothetical protein